MNQDMANLNEHIITLRQTPDKRSSFVCCRHCKMANPQSSVATWTKRAETTINHLQKCDNFAAHCRRIGVNMKELIDLFKMRPKKKRTKGMVGDEGAQVKAYANKRLSLQEAPTTGVKKGRKSAVTTGLGNAEIVKCNNLVFDTLFVNNLPFDVAESPAFANLCDFLRPGSSKYIYSKDQLTGSFLESRVESCAGKLNSKIANKGVTLTFNNWKTILEKKLLGVALSTNQNEHVVYALKDIQGTEVQNEVGNQVTVFNSHEFSQNIVELLAELKNKKVDVTAVCSDSHGELGEARRELADKEEYSAIEFIPCFANQMNITIADVITNSERYQVVIGLVRDLGKWFTDNDEMTNALHDIHRQQEQQEANGGLGAVDPLTGLSTGLTPIASLTSSVPVDNTPVLNLKVGQTDARLLGDSQWAKIYAMMDDMLQKRRALEFFAQDYVFHQYADFVKDPEAWASIQGLQSFCKTMCHALESTKKGSIKLHRVPYYFSLARIAIQSINDNSFVQDNLLLRLENRWMEWEHPLLILSYVLYPQLKHTFANRNDAGCPSVSTISGWLLQYTAKWYPDSDTFGIRRAFNEYLGGKGLFHEDMWKEYEQDCDIVSYWQMVKLNAAKDPEKILADVARRIFEIDVNCAGCDGLFLPYNEMRPHPTAASGGFSSQDLNKLVQVKQDILLSLKAKHTQQMQQRKGTGRKMTKKQQMEQAQLEIDVQNMPVDQMDRVDNLVSDLDFNLEMQAFQKVQESRDIQLQNQNLNKSLENNEEEVELPVNSPLCKWKIEALFPDKSHVLPEPELVKPFY